MSILSVEGVSVHYGDSQALWDVAFSVERGTLVALLGTNGAGKTTTLKSICGLLPLSSGQIKYEGRVISGMAVHEVVDLGITLVPQSVSALKAPGVVYIPFNDEPSAHADLSCMFRRGDPSSVLKEFLASIQTFRQRESARQEIVPPEQGAAP